jgi:hypothetical protein
VAVFAGLNPLVWFKSNADGKAAQLSWNEVVIFDVALPTSSLCVVDFTNDGKVRLRTPLELEGAESYFVPRTAACTALVHMETCMCTCAFVCF